MNEQPTRHITDLAAAIKSEAVQELIAVTDRYGLSYTIDEQNIIIPLPNYLGDDGVVGTLQVPVEDDEDAD